MAACGICPRTFSNFVADHYVFSANGKYDNPDPPAIEARGEDARPARDRAAFHQRRRDLVEAVRARKERQEGQKTLADLLEELRSAYGGKWKTNIRKEDDHSVIIKLAVTGHANRSAGGGRIDAQRTSSFAATARPMEFAVDRTKW